MNFETKRNKLIDKLKKNGYISNKKVIKAMKKVPRHLFVSKDLKNESYVDKPLPIGKNQTISAPHMVGILVQELNLTGEEKVLEIGSGSGYNASVIAEILHKGKVITIERHHKLADKAKENIKKSGYTEKIKIIVGDGSQGYKEEAPYDRILLTAGAPEIPQPLKEQLKENGIIVAPVGGRRSQTLIVGKKINGKIKEEKKGGCAFVPLKGKYGFS
ncbi:MAG: Protein-L-isoaspartate carboxylmethyltransferase Pcm [Candidatus Methanohalarchaeum thermophilum]|uniref:Protein-L-isoaspartate O-methyltransferase n=1 Tax=Methanohalarchaeum thermophilum TaxID=1903181 RepID=A0A1Q6DXH7_METT1|nr:MAG: Protein-L-isoaspartate carboxylmethyltransferase Pcm [Candidatus Methanohalarchaeum thermophilum]